MPALVPTLTSEEIDSLLNEGPITESIQKKAKASAKKRMANGLSPFWEEGEEVFDVPAKPKKEK